MSWSRLLHTKPFTIRAGLRAYNKARSQKTLLEGSYSIVTHPSCIATASPQEEQEKKEY